MSYVQGGLIEAVDFNTFRSQLLQVYGVGFGDSGYGQTAINVPTVTGGFVEAVKSLEWTNLRNAISICQQHQGISGALLPPVTDLQVGDEVVAHDGITDPDNFPQMLTNITNNRLSAPNTSTSLFLSRSVQTVSNTWNNTAFTIVDLDFPSADAARYFFNSGGEIIVRSSFTPNSSTPQNTSWQSLLNDVNSVVIDYNTVTNSPLSGGTTTAPLGYYNLPQSNPLALMFSASPPSGGGYYYYGANTYQIQGRTLNGSGTNGDNGRTVRLRIDLDDNFAGGSDVVDGTLTVEIDERRATTYLTVPSFTVTVQSPLSAS